jgi:hypothetical protein
MYWWAESRAGENEEENGTESNEVGIGESPGFIENN